MCILVDYVMDPRLDHFQPQKEVIQGLSKPLHKAATNAFPHTMAHPTKLGSVIQNCWYDEECHDTRRCLYLEVTRGIYTHKQTRSTFQSSMRY